MTIDNILLTGTGTVGREVLLALLRRTTSRVAVLMRDRGRRTASQRAEQLFASLGLAPDERARVDVVRGDVTRTGLGLEAGPQARLTECLDLVIHTAAVTSLTADSALCDGVNRAGTANALVFAERCFMRGQLSRFFHLSTALVAGGGSRAIVREDELAAAPAHINYYESSKYEAERIVRAAMQAGLPVTIFRPSMVVGDSMTGRTRDFNVIYPLMRIMASGYVTRFPADPRARVHLAPLDLTVDAIMRAIELDWTAGLTFHLTAPDPPTVADLFACDAFFPPGTSRPRLCPPDELDWSTCPARERELLDSVAFCFPYFNSQLTFETRNTARLVRLPVTDAAFLSRLGRYAVESGYIHGVAV